MRKTVSRNPRCRNRSRAVVADRDGFFLIVVLVVLAVATMAAYSFTDTMLAYDEASHLSGDHVQTQAAADSGVEAVRMMLAQPKEIRDSMGGLLDNPALFQAVNIVSIQDGGRACNYSIIGPGMDQTGRLAGVRFGLQNESARLNVNALITLEKNASGLMPVLAMTSGDALSGASDTLAGAAASGEVSSDSIAATLLLALPGMTADIADCILDWLDEDDEIRPYGAELEYYSTLPTPYRPANGPINSVEELLLVKGVTPALLFGVDANRNGVIDAAEQQTVAVDINSTASLGWSAYVTVHGLEGNRRSDGTSRIDLNQEDVELLYEEISGVIDNQDYATFLAAYRLYGKPAASLTAMATGEEGGQATAAGANNAPSSNEIVPWSAEEFEQVDLTAGAAVKYSQLLDVIDGTLTIGNGENARVYASPFTSDPVQMALYMPLLMENFSTQDFETMPGRININDCAAELLYGLPVLDEETATSILEARSQPTESTNRMYETWPLVEGLVTLDQMKSMMPLVTAGGDVYRAQIVGYYEGSAAATRVEVIVDGSKINPRVIHYRDLSHLGRGFDISVLGIRNMQTLSDSPTATDAN